MTRDFSTSFSRPRYQAAKSTSQCRESPVVGIAGQPCRRCGGVGQLYAHGDGSCVTIVDCRGSMVVSGLDTLGWAQGQAGSYVTLRTTTPVYRRPTSLIRYISDRQTSRATTPDLPCGDSAPGRDFVADGRQPTVPQVLGRRVTAAHRAQDPWHQPYYRVDIRDVSDPNA
jgi:hypothetical protein